jgi:hypothetical protein
MLTLLSECCYHLHLCWLLSFKIKAFGTPFKMEVLSAWSMTLWSRGLVLTTDGSGMAGRSVWGECREGYMLFTWCACHSVQAEFCMILPWAKNCIWRPRADEDVYEGHLESEFTKCIVRIICYQLPIWKMHDNSIGIRLFFDMVSTSILSLIILLGWVLLFPVFRNLCPFRLTVVSLLFPPHHFETCGRQEISTCPVHLLHT